MTFQNGQFFGGDGIRTADLYRDLRTGGEIEGFFQSRQDGIHLIRRQDAGGAAAHVKGAGAQTIAAHHIPAGADLRDQSLYIGLHQRKTSLHALTDKGAVGAAGGAEGDAHIQVDVPLIQPLPGLIAHGAGLQGQGGPVLRNKVMLFQIVLGFLRCFALHQRPGDGLVGPHAGEHAPGGQGQLFSGPDFLRQLGIQVLEGQVKAGRYGVAPLALFFKIRAGKGGGECPGGGVSVIVQLR